MDTTQVGDIYDVVFFWDNNRNTPEYKQYCAETLCHILGYPPPLSVKLVFEAEEKGKTLVYCTRNMEKAVEIRNTLSSLNMLSEITLAT